MNKIRWRILWAICLLLSAIPISTTGQVWASVSQQPTSAVNLLLQDQEESQALPSAQIQSIVTLLLQDDDEARYQIFLPLVRR